MMRTVFLLITAAALSGCTVPTFPDKGGEGIYLVINALPNDIMDAGRQIFGNDKSLAGFALVFPDGIEVRVDGVIVTPPPMPLLDDFSWKVHSHERGHLQRYWTGGVFNWDSGLEVDDVSSARLVEILCGLGLKAARCKEGSN